MYGFIIFKVNTMAIKLDLIGWFMFMSILIVLYFVILIILFCFTEMATVEINSVSSPDSYHN